MGAEVIFYQVKFTNASGVEKVCRHGDGIPGWPTDGLFTSRQAAEEGIERRAHHFARLRCYSVVEVSGPLKVSSPPPTPPVPAPTLTTDKQARKETPMARGLVDYFPRALAAVSHVSFVANEQHNPGQPMHWAKGKSTDHADCIMRHLVERGTTDDDSLRHSAKLAWRALALLETELETEATK